SRLVPHAPPPKLLASSPPTEMTGMSRLTRPWLRSVRKRAVVDMDPERCCAPLTACHLKYPCFGRSKSRRPIGPRLAYCAARPDRRRSVGGRRVQLQVVAVGVLERGDLAPRVLRDLVGELDPF